MKLTTKHHALGNSSGFYKDNNFTQRAWYVRWYNAIRAWLKWGWDYARKAGWIMSSILLFLVLPTVVAKSIEINDSMMSEFPGSPIN